MTITSAPDGPLVAPTSAPPASAAKPPEAPAEPPSTGARVERTSRLRLSRVELLASGAGLVGASVQPAAGAEVALHLGPLRLAGLFVGTPLAESAGLVANDGTQRGTLTTRSFLAAGTAAWCFGSSVEWCPGVLGGARLAVGTASGDYIFHSTTAWLGTPTAGPMVHLAWPATRRLFAAVDLVLLVNPLQPAFVVEGLITRAPFTVVEGHARLSIGLNLWR